MEYNSTAAQHQQRFMQECKKMNIEVRTATYFNTHGGGVLVSSCDENVYCKTEYCKTEYCKTEYCNTEYMYCKTEWRWKVCVYVDNLGVMELLLSTALQPQAFDIPNCLLGCKYFKVLFSPSCI